MKFTMELQQIGHTSSCCESSINIFRCISSNELRQCWYQLNVTVATAAVHQELKNMFEDSFNGPGRP